MPSRTPLILLCAGGTGGHMFPARALAEELLGRGCRVALACDTRGRKYFDGMESRVDIHILSSGTYRPGLIGKIGFVLPLLKGYLQALFLVRKLKPQVAVGFGGYPSAPPLWAAKHNCVPLVLHEQNAILGLANILFVRSCRKLALSWRGTTGLGEKNQSKTVVTGNPVRAEISALRDQAYPPVTGQINLLIVGGSQGAAVFSDIMPKAIGLLPADIVSRLQVVQQARPDKLEDVQSYYRGHGLSADVQPFFNDMPDRLRDCHLLITRSGASTVAELTAAGRPAIYVPYPWNRDNQQTFNAKAVVDVGGGWLIQEKDMTAKALADMLLPLLQDPDQLAAAAEKAKTVGQPEAARKLADLVLGELR